MHLLPAALIALVALAFRMYELGRPSIWLDEAISLWGAGLPWRSLAPQLAVRDESPPLYFALLHIWTDFGETEAWVRLLSVLCSLVVVMLGGCLGARVAGRSAGYLAALFLALAPPQVFYAQEARMYAQVAALTLAAAHCALFALAGAHARWAVAWGLFTAATAATHYTAALAVAALLGATGAVALARRSRTLLSRVALAAGVASVAWLPVAPMFVTQSRLVAAHYWIPQPTPAYTVAELLGATVGGAPPESHVQLSDPITISSPMDLVPASMAVLRAAPLRRVSLAFSHNANLVLPAILALAVAGLAAVRARWGAAAVALGAAAALPPIVLLLVSQVRPLLLARAMLSSGTLAVVLAAAGCAALPRPLRAGVVVLLVWHFLLGGGEHWWYPGGEDWRGAAARVATQARDGDLLLVDGRWMELPLRYYLRRIDTPPLEIHGVPVDFDARGKPEPVTSETDLPRIAALARGLDRVWLVLSHTTDTDPQLLSRRMLEAEFGGCFEVWPYQAVTVLRFERCGST